MESKRFGHKQTAAIVFILVLFCVWIGSSYAASLPPNQVRALHAIAKELGNTDWNFSSSVNPCSDDVSWKTQNNNQQNTNYVNQLICSCSGAVCQVVNISLKGQDLAGVLPKSLAKLPYIKCIDLSRNYLNGSIPIEWASMAYLEYVSVMVNRLSGPIPAYLGKMTSLTYLSIENNMFSGRVPAELGKLVNLSNLHLNANYLTGPLPKALTNLSKLTELRISSNNFSGKIPDFIQSWTALQRLEIQGSGFSGPIPSAISNLTDLVDLRISDLDGEGSDFPDLQNMANLQFLLLRNCNISGSIPTDLAKLSKLKTLDLSFNNLVGPLRDELQIFKKNLNHMYLTNNFLNGSVSDWISGIGQNSDIDLSYNNFNKSSLPSTCNDVKLNLYRSSSRELNSSLAVCLDQNFPCLHTGHSLHINCGGDKIKVGKKSYEADNDRGGPTKFNPNKAEWGYSSTGDFWNWNDGYSGDYIARNDSLIPATDAELYTQARISAISLTYYGRCLAPGNYTVTLYFAELEFRNNNSYYRLGRRFFDIYIQEKLIIKNFDIVKAANGSEKACIVKRNNVPVADTGTIEIRLYYAGKGTAEKGRQPSLLEELMVHSFQLSLWNLSSVLL